MITSARKLNTVSVALLQSTKHMKTDIDSFVKPSSALKLDALQQRF